jgi:hypothetical protein
VNKNTLERITCLNIDKKLQITVRIMGLSERNLKENKSYRTLIDSEGIGHIRIIRRINLKTLIEIFKSLYLELKEDPDKKPRINIYVSRSIYEEMSDNMKHFHDFVVSCMDGTFDLIIIS